METAGKKKKIPRKYAGCLIKNFPRTFQYGGKNYEITEDKKKYFNNVMNTIFLENFEHPLPVNQYGNVIRKMNKKVAQSFSRQLSRIGAKERENRTLSLKND
jgi:hypothetical protein